MNALSSQALVLNSRWQPLHITSVKDAIALIAKGSAKVIDPDTFQAYDLLSWADASRAREKYEGPVIRSQHLALVPPEVILLTTYEGLAERSVVFSRRNVFKRDRYTCQ